MAQTVIGFFDEASEAQRAVEQLQSRGISRDRIDISSGNASNASYDSRTTGVSRDRDDDNGITRFFKNLFGDDDNDADRYSKVASNSNYIVTVHAQSSDEADTAADILDDCGAIDVDERAAQYGYTRTGSTDSMENRSDRTGDRDTTIERIEENLEVGKREVETGGVRVRSRIVERPVEENIRLREEHVRVERNPVNRPVSGDELNRLQETDIELTERAEVPVVNKEARVVEEIRLSKEVEERNETIRDNVRHTEVDVDNIDRGTTNRSNLDTDEDDNDDLRPNRGL
jgi:stress response protein YsnF